MAWSHATPTVSGRYWWRWKERGFDPDILIVAVQNGAYFTVNRFAMEGGEWDGPIAEPEEHHVA